MMTDEVVVVSQDCNSGDQTATKQFLITLVLFCHQITTV